MTPAEAAAARLRMAPKPKTSVAPAPVPPSPVAPAPVVPTPAPTNTQTYDPNSKASILKAYNSGQAIGSNGVTKPGTTLKNTLQKEAPETLAQPTRGQFDTQENYDKAVGKFKTT